MTIQRAVVLAGSAKPAGASTSEALARYLCARLKDRGVTTTLISVSGPPQSRAEAALDAALVDADLFVLATPLYVDSLPYLVTRTLESLARSSSPRRSRCAFAAVINCGFPEAGSAARRWTSCERSRDERASTGLVEWRWAKAGRSTDRRSRRSAGSRGACEWALIARRRNSRKVIVCRPPPSNSSRAGSCLCASIPSWATLDGGGGPRGITWVRRSTRGRSSQPISKPDACLQTAGGHRNRPMPTRRAPRQEGSGPASPVRGRVEPMTRRQLLALAGSWAAAGATARGQHQMAPRPTPRPSTPPIGDADITLRIGEMTLDLAPRRSVRTLAYNGQVPGPVLRAKQGKPADGGRVERHERGRHRALARYPHPVGSGRRVRRGNARRSTQRRPPALRVHAGSGWHSLVPQPRFRGPRICKRGTSRASSVCSSWMAATIPEPTSTKCRCSSTNGSRVHAPTGTDRRGIPVPTRSTARCSAPANRSASSRHSACCFGSSTPARRCTIGSRCPTPIQVIALDGNAVPVPARVPILDSVRASAWMRSSR